MSKTINCLVDHKGAPCTCDMSMYENLNKPIKTPTQNDWEDKLRLHKETVLWKADERIKGLSTRFMYDADFIESFIPTLLADARREVIDSIHGKFCEFAIQGGDDEQAQKGILLYARTLQYLATLRKEGK